MSNISSDELLQKSKFTVIDFIGYSWNAFLLIVIYFFFDMVHKNLPKLQEDDFAIFQVLGVIGLFIVLMNYIYNKLR